MIIGGTVYLDGNPKRGYIDTLTGKFKDQEPDKGDDAGTIILAPINSHTHLGDTFIQDEPFGTLAEIVGPGGFKLKHLNSASEDVIIKGIAKSKKIMRDSGTCAFIDFRETGSAGISTIMAEKTGDPFAIVLSGAKDVNDYLKIKDKVNGIELSAISDIDLSFGISLSKAARAEKGITGIHFSERYREDISSLKEINPDLVIHCLYCTKEDIHELAGLEIPIVITPRSNVFYGERKDYNDLCRETDLVLLGTDNAMNTEPHIFREMEFLFRYQRGINRLSPELIIDMVTSRPRHFIEKMKVKIPNSYLLFPEVDLKPYEIVMRSHYYDFKKISHTQ